MKRRDYSYIGPLTAVRDYECDLQGVVNHANYLHYLEHARHTMLAAVGESFAKCHDEGFDMFVSRTELDYRSSLRSGDSFRIGINLSRKGALLVADQDVIREEDGAIACRGKVFVVGVQDGQVTRGEYFDHLIELFAKKECEEA